MSSFNYKENMDFSGKRLQLSRKRIKMTQKEAAEKLGVSLSVYSLSRIPILRCRRSTLCRYRVPQYR